MKCKFCFITGIHLSKIHKITIFYFGTKFYYDIFTGYYDKYTDKCNVSLIITVKLFYFSG